MSILSALPLIRIAELKVDGGPQQELAFAALGSLVPAGTKHLLIEVNAAQTYTERRFCEVMINGDTGNRYNRREFMASGTAVTTTNTTNTNVAQGVDIPPAGTSRFGGGYIFFPHAFRTDNLKLWQSMGSSLETRLQRHACSWESTAAIDTITLQPWRNVPGGVNQWAAGSIVTLYAVDESRLVEEKVLSSAGKFTFGTLPADTRHLIMLMHLRSGENLATRQGDRVYQLLNNDQPTSNYKVQRFGGENMASNLIIDEDFTEKRVGWSAAAAAAADSYGNLVVMYPEFRSTDFQRPWISQHAAFEEIYFPVSQENGRWMNTSALTQLHYYPGSGANYLPGSRMAAYKPNPSGTRHVVAAAGEASVTLTVPADAVGLRVIVVARTNANQAEDRITIELNGDAAAGNYAIRRASAVAGTNETAVTVDNEFGVVPGGTAEAGIYGCGAMSVVQHAATDRYKHVLSTIGASGGRLALYGGLWKNTAAVTTITFKPKNGTLIAGGSVFELVTAEDEL